MAVRAPCGCPADVVHHQRPAVDAAVGDEADVDVAVRKPPGDDVAGAIVARRAADRQLAALAGEERREVGDAAVIDVGIRLRQAPFTPERLKAGMA